MNIRSHRSAFHNRPSKIAAAPQKLQEFLALVSNAFANPRAGDFSAKAGIAQHVAGNAEHCGGLGFGISELVPYSGLLALLPFEHGSYDTLDERAQKHVVEMNHRDTNRNGALARAPCRRFIRKFIVLG